MHSSRYFPWLHRLTYFTAIATWFLICLGGHVTSTESGLAVPDWPTSYGFNMFLFPWTRMVGGVFWEHSHRLVASAIGLFTIIMAIFFFMYEPRRWIKTLALVAIFAVIVQGLLGGLRVICLKAELGIFHAALAQGFFGLLCFLSWMTSKESIRLQHESISTESHQLSFPSNLKESHLPWGWLKRMAFLLTLTIFIQLVLGASMRHEHAGLAVPDFPLAYGNVFPSLDHASLAKINALRQHHLDMPPTSATQILLHMSHRVVAIGILIGLVLFFMRVRKYFPPGNWARKSVLVGVGLIMIQFSLGIATIWTQKAAELATAHVAVGAAILAWSVLLTARSSQYVLIYCRHSGGADQASKSGSLSIA